MSVEDLTGQQFDRIVVVAYSHKHKKKHRWLCRCLDCGRVTAKTRYEIWKYNCKCHQAEAARANRLTHGHTQGKFSKTYSAWNNMRQRCENPANGHYGDYGGRGIRVCDRWQVFEHFLEDMGECPDGLTIERVNNAGNYEPGNCRWATVDEQARNKRNNRWLTLNGRTMCAKDWARELGIHYMTLITRMNRGWSDDECLTIKPVVGQKVHGRL
jgi:hypothetical protein